MEMGVPVEKIIKAALFKGLTKEEMEPMVFGEVAMLTKAERSATVIAVKECSGIEISGSELGKLCEENNKLGYKIMANLAEVLSDRLRKANREVVRLATALSVALR